MTEEEEEGARGSLWVFDWQQDAVSLLTERARGWELVS